MAGRGSRFLEEADKNLEFSKPKPIIDVAGHPMVEWALSSIPLNQNDRLIFLVLKEHVTNHRIDKRLLEIFHNNVEIVVVDTVTEGAACTVLLAEKYIDNETPLLITDSDHYIDGETLIKEINKSRGRADGIIPIFYANNSKWSFSKLGEDGFVEEVAEKVQISRKANIGMYYFLKGRDFVWAAKEMIEEEDRTNGEFFVAPIYNYMIRRGKKIGICRPKFVHGLGTPKDFYKFLKFLRLGDIIPKFVVSFEQPKINIEEAKDDEKKEIRQP